MRAVRLGVVAGALWSLSVHAGPDATANFLMNDSVSLMDWGIAQMEQRLEASGYFSDSGMNRPIMGVDYDWDANRIVIEASAFIQDKASQSAGDAICRELVQAIRRTFGINLKTGQPFNKKYSWAAVGFSHRGYARKTQPDNLLQQVDKLIDIKATIFQGNKETGCRAGLLGSDIFTKSQ